jgi:hypothetical protein
MLDLSVFLGAHTTSASAIVEQAVNNAVSTQVVLLPHIVSVDCRANAAKEESHETSHHASISIHFILVFAVYNG